MEGSGWWEWRNRKPSRRWQDLRPAPPQTPAPSLPGGPASQSGAKRGVASLGRETSLGRLNPDFFNKLPLIVRAWGGVAALAVGRRRGRPVTASGRRVQTWFLCRHRKRLPRAAGSPPGRRGQGRARPGYAEPAGRGPAAGRHGGCGRRSVAIHHPGPPEAGWSGAAPPRPVRSAGGGLMLSPRPEVLRSPGAGSVPRGRLCPPWEGALLLLEALSLLPARSNLRCRWPVTWSLHLPLRGVRDRERRTLPSDQRAL